MGNDNEHVRKYEEYLQKISQIAFGGAPAPGEIEKSQQGKVASPNPDVWNSLYNQDYKVDENYENYETSVFEYIKENQEHHPHNSNEDIYTRFRRFYNRSEDPKIYNTLESDDGDFIVDHNDDIIDEYNYVNIYETFIIERLPVSLRDYINHAYDGTEITKINDKAKKAWDNELIIKVNELVGEALDTYFYLHPGYHALMQREAINLRPDEMFTLKMIHDPKFYLTENYNIIKGDYIKVEEPQATEEIFKGLFPIRNLSRLGVVKKITKRIRVRPNRVHKNHTSGGGISSFTMEDYCFKYYKPYYDMYYK